MAVVSFSYTVSYRTLKKKSRSDLLFRAADLVSIVNEVPFSEANQDLKDLDKETLITIILKKMEQLPE